MSIEFNIDDIDLENRKKIYEKLPNGKRQLSIKTQTIIWYCSRMIGVQEISENNYQDTFDRIFQYEEIFGTKAVRWEDVYNEISKKRQQEPIYYSIEIEDIKLLFGIKIICEPLTKDEWNQKITDMKQRLHKRTKEIEEGLQEKHEVRYVNMKEISTIIPEPESKNIKEVLPVDLPDNPRLNTKLEE